jgi:hypothetical protein
LHGLRLSALHALRLSSLHALRLSPLQRLRLGTLHGLRLLRGLGLALGLLLLIEPLGQILGKPHSRRRLARRLLLHR